MIMHMGSLPVIASKKPENFKHIVFNNGMHDSVGGQPTVGYSIDVPSLARSCQYGSVFQSKDSEDLRETRNLYLQHPEIVYRLKTTLEKIKNDEHYRPTELAPSPKKLSVAHVNALFAEPEKPAQQQATLVKIGGAPIHYRYMAFPFCLAVCALAGLAESFLFAFRLDRFRPLAPIAGVAVAALAFLSCPRQLSEHPFTPRGESRVKNKINEAQ